MPALVTAGANKVPDESSGKCAGEHTNVLPLILGGALAEKSPSIVKDVTNVAGDSPDNALDKTRDPEESKKSA